MVDGRIECLICGRKLPSLGPHLAGAHQMAARPTIAHGTICRRIRMPPRRRRLADGGQLSFDALGAAPDAEPKRVRARRGHRRTAGCPAVHRTAAKMEGLGASR